ncbi:MAG: hypothetical protein KDB90_12385 [Planctomycetes bacterium]|nr:hypothetical protein [Planctomycetota bacterium]
MAKKLRDGFNAWHTPGFRLTDQGLAERGVKLDRNAVFATDPTPDHTAYDRWLAVIACASVTRRT